MPPLFHTQYAGIGLARIQQGSSTNMSPAHFLKTDGRDDRRYVIPVSSSARIVCCLPGDKETSESCQGFQDSQTRHQVVTAVTPEGGGDDAHQEQDQRPALKKIDNEIQARPPA
jgi:hypothetical protein